MTVYSYGIAWNVHLVLEPVRVSVSDCLSQSKTFRERRALAGGVGDEDAFGPSPTEAAPSSLTTTDSFPYRQGSVSLDEIAQSGQGPRNPLVGVSDVVRPRFWA